MERWAVIEDYENYMISDHGRLYNTKTKRYRKVKIGRYDTQQISRKGGPCAVHRLVAMYFVAPFNGEIVHHIDGNKKNNHYTNLEWTTQRQNVNYATSRLNMSSKYPGVSKYKNVYMTFIKYKGKLYNLGSYIDEMIAATAYRIAHIYIDNEQDEHKILAIIKKIRLQLN